MYIFLRGGGTRIHIRISLRSPVDRGSIASRVIPKTKKWYLMPPWLTLSIIRYKSRVKWSNPGNRVAPYPNLGVVAIEKGASGRPRLRLPIFFSTRMTSTLNNPWRLICHLKKKLSQKCAYIYIYLPNSSTQALCDTSSVFKRSLTGLNSNFSFSKISCHTELKGSVCPAIYS